MNLRTIIVAFVCLLNACGNNTEGQILFFTHEGCPYCDKALQYINANYKQLPMQVLEVGKPENMKKFVACANKFKLDKQKLGTPLICMDDNYILGWSDMNAAKFRKYVKPYIK